MAIKTDFQGDDSSAKCLWKYLVLCTNEESGSGFSFLSSNFSSSSDSSSSLSNLKLSKLNNLNPTWIQDFVQEFSKILWHPLFPSGGNSSSLMQGVFGNFYFLLIHKPLFSLIIYKSADFMFQYPNKPLAFCSLYPWFSVLLEWMNMVMSL